jgi:beta-mannosidase
MVLIVCHRPNLPHPFAPLTSERGPSDRARGLVSLRPMELSGRWVATEANDDVRRFGISLDSDDSDWAPIAVPGHWQHAPTLEASTGPVMYRHRFWAEPPAEGTRRWITLDGILYQGDAWLDGAYLGDAEGYFSPHSFEVTQLARIGDEHVLAVEVACPPQSDVRTSITGILQGWPGLPDGWNPGGLWRSVQMYDTGPVRINRLRVLCRDADAGRAHVVFSTTLDSVQALDIVVRTYRNGEAIDEQLSAIASGQNELEWSVDIRDPELWWPRELGDQPLSTFTVEVTVDGDRSDSRSRRIGLRQIEWSDWILSINGERLFLRGANLWPMTTALADVTDAMVERDFGHALDLGLNALRVRGHIGPRRLYDRADELGLLLLQDFPLERIQARNVRGRAVAQAELAVDQFGHHPSIALWSAHNEPTGAPTASETDWRGRLRDTAAQQLPTWNKSILDRWVKRAFERSDPSRPTIAHSGVVPHLPQLDGTDSHLWYGWRQGDARDLARRANRLPRVVRFVSEFGSDSVPTSAAFIDRQLVTRAWPNLDWEAIASEFGYARETMEALFDPVDFDTFDAWRETTQLYQSYVLKVQIETLRRLKYRPTGGFCFSALADPSPTISASVLDDARIPKDAYESVRQACAPVIVVADLLPDWINPGDRLSLDVHLVNDRRTSIAAARVTATADWAGGHRTWEFGGPVDADEVVKVGVIDFEVPDTLGELAIELVATEADGTPLNGNRYTTAVTLPPT